MQNSESAVGQEPAVDMQLARKDLVVKLLAKLSNEDRSLLLVQRGGRPFGGRAVADDRNERKYDKGEIVSSAAEAIEGRATFDARRTIAGVM